MLPGRDLQGSLGAQAATQLYLPSHPLRTGPAFPSLCGVVSQEFLALEQVEGLLWGTLRKPPQDPWPQDLVWLDPPI